MYSWRRSYVLARCWPLVGAVVAAAGCAAGPEMPRDGMTFGVGLVADRLDQSQWMIATWYEGSAVVVRDESGADRRKFREALGMAVASAGITEPQPDVSTDCRAAAGQEVGLRPAIGAQCDETIVVATNPAPAPGGW